MTTPSFVVGIDAGGTSLRASLARSGDESEILTAATPAAPDGGPEPLRQLVPDLLGRASAPASSVGVVCAGVAKITRGDTGKQWEAMLAELLPGARALVVPDYEIAFHGAAAGASGLAVIAGTGSVAYGMHRGQAVRVGGRGWEWGDEGSGGWLTAEMLRRTLRALDGLEAPSSLTRAVSDRLATGDAAQLGERARVQAAEQGRGFLAPLLLALARDGDIQARNLYVGAGGWLAVLARAGLEKLSFGPDDSPVVAMVGGLWQAGELLTGPFTHVLHRWYPAAHVQSADAPPLTGAVRLANRHAGGVD